MSKLDESELNVSQNLSEGIHFDNLDNSVKVVETSFEGDDKNYNMSEYSLKQQLQDNLNKDKAEMSRTTIVVPPRSQINLESKNYQKMLINQKNEIKLKNLNQ